MLDDDIYEEQVPGTSVILVGFCGALAGIAAAVGVVIGGLTWLDRQIKRHT